MSLGWGLFSCNSNITSMFCTCPGRNLSSKPSSHPKNMFVKISSRLWCFHHLSRTWLTELRAGFRGHNGWVWATKSITIKYARGNGYWICDCTNLTTLQFQKFHFQLKWTELVKSEIKIVESRGHNTNYNETGNAAAKTSWEYMKLTFWNFD